MWKLFEPRSTAARTSGTLFRATGKRVGQRLGVSREDSGGERRAAAAGRRGVRITDHELRALEVFLVVDLGTRQVLDAHRIDQQADPLVQDAGVALFRVFVEREAILETRTAA